LQEHLEKAFFLKAGEFVLSDDDVIEDVDADDIARIDETPRDT